MPSVSLTPATSGALLSSSDRGNSSKVCTLNDSITLANDLRLWSNMADPLSLAASAFAVVGVADLALRASKGVYQFLSDIKNAPTEIENLRSCVGDNIRLVEQSKQLSQELSSQNVPPTTNSFLNNSKENLELLKTVIRSLNRELDVLAKLAKKHAGASKTWGSIRWILDDKKVLKSLQKLEASKTSLNSALSLLGRYGRIDSLDIR